MAPKDRYDDMTRPRLIALLRERDEELRDVADHRRAVHELRIHQEELAAQNAQLEDARRAVERAHEQYQELFDFGPIPIFVLDSNGVIERCNLAAARLLEAERQRVVGSPLLVFTTVTDRRVALDHMRRCRAHLGAVTTELTLKNRQGTEVPVLVTSEALDPSAEQRRYLTAALDLRTTRAAEAERRRAELERERREADQRVARAASDAKDRFLAALSHELRTPLTPVLLATSAWQNDASLSNPLRQTLKMIARNVAIEARLIDDLLDVTRILQRKLVLHPQIVDVHTLLEDVVDQAAPQIGEAALDVALDFAARRWTVRADPVRLRQIASNLLANAIRYTPAGGRIAVRTEDANGTLRLLVSDTGAGFEEREGQTIFEPFSQGPESVRAGGLGLGLAIAKGLVEAHHGTIAAESPGPGRGATFTVELPVAEGDEGRPAAADATPDELPRPGARILLVEDHEDTAIALSYVLQGQGYQVETAGSVAEALERARRNDVDLVVSDLGLPDGSGLDLMRRLRSERPIPGIALTGYGRPEDLAEVEAAGFARHLVKPVDVPTLIAAIEGVREKD